MRSNRLKLGVSVVALLAAGVSARAANTSVQWGANRTSSPWSICLYDSADVCQNFFTLPATGGGALLPPVTGGTGVNNGANTLTLGGVSSLAGAFTTVGAFSLTLTTTGATNVTLPTTGTLATTASIASALPSATTSQIYGGSGSPGQANVLTTLPALAFPALTGDVTTSAGALATTLATVNTNVGAFGSATQAIVATFNGKGLVTAVANALITPAIGSITGLGTGVATLLGSASSGTGGPVGKVSPTVTGIFTIPAGSAVISLASNGGADNSTPINAAITAQNSAPYREITLGPGIFNVQSTVSLTSNVDIGGQGGSNYSGCVTTIKWNGTLGGGPVVQAVASSANVIQNLGLHDLCIDANSASPAAIAFVKEGVNSGRFTNVQFANASSEQVLEQPAASPIAADQNSIWTGVWEIATGSANGHVVANVGTTYDVSSNIYDLSILSVNGTAFVMGDGDKNVFTRFYSIVTGSGVSFECQASSVAGNQCRENSFTGQAQFEGGIKCDAGSQKPFGIIIDGYARGDGEPGPYANGCTPAMVASVDTFGIVTGYQTMTLGWAGSAIGTLQFFNATSGSITLEPPTGALGSVTDTLPDTSTTLAGLGVTQTFTAPQTINNQGSLALNVLGPSGTDAVHISNGGSAALSLYSTANSSASVQCTTGSGCLLNLNPSGGAVAVGGTLGVPQATWTDTQTCTVGQISVDAAFIYVCTASNVVKRAALSSF